MAIAQADLLQISEHVQQNLAQWIAHIPVNGDRTSLTYEIEIRERIVRVEEELRHQRELMREGFEKMDLRFADMQKYMDKRFEAMDKRFEVAQLSINQRFESMQLSINQRFEAMDTRFEDMIKYMNSRFSSLQWLMGIGFTLITVLMSIYHFLGR